MGNEVNNERGTRFWKINGARVSLWGGYSRNFTLKLKTLQDWSFHIDQDIGWNIKVPYLNQEENVDKKVELLQLLLENLSCNIREKDRPSWECDCKWVFSVKNTYFRLNDGGLRCSYAKFLWNAKVPQKIRAFLWLVINGALLAWDNLTKRGWRGRNICVMCVGDEKTTITCPSMFVYPKHLWEVSALP